MQFHCPLIERKSGLILLGISQIIWIQNSVLSSSAMPSFKMQLQCALKVVKLKQLRHICFVSPSERVAPCHPSRHNALLNRCLGEKAAKRPWMNNECAHWGRKSKWRMSKLFSTLSLWACGKGSGESVDSCTLKQNDRRASMTIGKETSQIGISIVSWMWHCTCLLLCIPMWKCPLLAVSTVLYLVFIYMR